MDGRRVRPTPSGGRGVFLTERVGSSGRAAELEGTAAATDRCRACGVGRAQWIHQATERAFGLGGAFRYGECGICRSLSLSPVPELAGYYPDSYYSLEAASPAGPSWPDRLSMHAPGGSLLPTRVGLLRRAGLRPGDAVLDVGGGGGGFLLRLAALGFTKLVGVDPYLPARTDLGQQIELIKGTIWDVAGRFDVITFNHSLEHVADPVDQLLAARERLTDGGRIVVRVPVLGHAWRAYGEHWVQLDAPRHLTLFSREGLLAAASRAGLAVRDLHQVSTGFQLWGSRGYARDLTLGEVMARRASEAAPTKAFRRLSDTAVATWLNVRGDGDEVLAVLTPAGQQPASTGR